MLSEKLRILFTTKRLGQFMSVGAAGAIIDNIVLVAIVESAFLSPTPGAFISKECSIIFMFILNERITFSGFGSDGKFAVLHRLFKSNLVRAGGALVGIGILHILVTWAGIWYLLANIIGIGGGFLFNYVFESIVTWKVTKS